MKQQLKHIVEQYHAGTLTDRQFMVAVIAQMNEHCDKTWNDDYVPYTTWLANAISMAE
jgi:hypothetical protein